MEPNYSEYSITELKDALANIDELAFPNRVEQIKSELMSRQSQVKSSPERLDDNFESNEQFFKCPTCEKKIGFFSKTANKWGKKKVCPHCNSSFETSVKLKIVAIALIPALFINFLILRPIVVSFGLHGAISTGILCGILVMIATRYSKVRNTHTA